MTEPPSASAEPIGFIGLGTMGRPMARRLRARGENLVVWTRTRSKAADIADDRVRFASDVADVARSCRVVLSCLLDDAAIEDVYLGPDGVIANAAAGSLLVEHGTFTPALARRLDSAAADSSIQFLDAPVSGGAAGAAAGNLVTMVGGTPDAVARLAPVASAYCTLVERIGPSGAGVTLKLVNQMLVAANVVSTVEAAAVIRAAGISVDAAERVLTGGWAASAMLARNLRAAVTGEFPAEGAGIGAMADVLALAREVVRSLGVPTVLEPLVYAQFVSSSRSGFAEHDLSALPLTPGR